MTVTAAVARMSSRRGGPSTYRAAALLAFVASSLTLSPSSAFHAPRPTSASASCSSPRSAVVQAAATAGSTGGSGFLPASVAAAASSVRTVSASSSQRRSASLSMSASSSWETLRTAASSTPVGSSLNAEMDLRARGRGSAFVQSNLRLFNSNEERPKLTLYRDHAGWCPYCQKTMLLIEEKGIPINIELVPMRSYGDKPQSFLNKVPSGLLPALGVEREEEDDDGRRRQQQIITESQVIMELLDKWHPPSEGYKPMLPPEDDTEGRKKYERLARLERELFSWWCTLTFRPEGPRLGGGGGLMGMLGGGGGGGGGQAMSGSMKGFLECLDQVDAALTSAPGPWFFSSSEFPEGDYPTMIDFVYASHVERMLASAAYWKGLDLRSPQWRERYPGINGWFDALEKRECYRAFQSDYYTHVMDIPPQYGPGYDGGFEEERKRMSRCIAGRDGQSWRLPLPHDDPLQPLYRGPPLPVCALEAAGISADADGTYLSADPDAMSKACRHMAGWKLASNGPAVAKFAARGGSGGATNPRKGFGAQLADPYAEPDRAALPHVDAALQVVCAALMEDESKTDAEHVGGLKAEDVLGAVPSEMSRDVAASLAYLRDRVGVPRDMPLAAARQLRAHLSWAIDALMSKAS